MVRVMHMHSVQFRNKMGRVQLVQPQGSRLLRVHQTGSGYWIADMLTPSNADGEEPLELWLITNRDQQQAMPDDWHCVGHSHTNQGLRVYVFQQVPQPAKRKAGRPRKAAASSPVDDKAD